MKKNTLYILIALIGLLAGCKENKWMDWKAQNDLWLEQNRETYKNDSNFHELSDGLQYRIIADPGKENGETSPRSTSTVICDYTGKLINGYQFDGGTASFSMSSVVSGFAEGLYKIHQHGDIEIYVPYSLGYDEENISNGKTGSAEGSGTEGTSSYIPPYSVLIFRVHVSSISN